MNHFLNLHDEKQNRIIRAALALFAANGYKKTSVNDIARASGISKSMVFHYFGTKSELYQYLVDFCTELYMDEINSRFDMNVTDVFDRALLVTEIRTAAVKKFPYVLKFLRSAYADIDSAGDDIALKRAEAFDNAIAFDGINRSRFKDGDMAGLLIKTLSWLSEGYTLSLSDIPEETAESEAVDFKNCVALLKNAIYNEDKNEDKTGERKI